MGKRIAHFLSLLIAAAEFCIVLLIVGVFLWRSAVFREAFMNAGDTVTAWAVRQWPSLGGVLMSQPLRWIAISALVFITVAVLGILLRLISRRYLWFLITLRGAEHLVNVAALLACFAFGAYLYSILWGDVKMLGHTVVRAYEPNPLNFFHGTDIGRYALLYAAVQCAPLAFRPDRRGLWFAFDTLISAYPAYLLLGAWYSYFLDPAAWQHWTVYRVETMELAIIAIGIDITRVFTGVYLLLRGWVDSGPAPVLGGDGH